MNIDIIIALVLGGMIGSFLTTILLAIFINNSHIEKYEKSLEKENEHGE